MSRGNRSNVRRSGNSLVLTVPFDICKELGLEDGDAVFWLPNSFATRLKIIKSERIEELIEAREARAAR
jgi:antitoxin component of MazEF toxin-antitoxin module